MTNMSAQATVDSLIDNKIYLIVNDAAADTIPPNALQDLTSLQAALMARPVAWDGARTSWISASKSLGLYHG